MTEITASPPPWVFVVLSWLWIGGMVLGSVLYRRSRGKPVFATSPAGCLFEERWTSGHELGGIRAVGGARNALKVCVTRDTLYLMPCFPFTLMFLPEVWGIEHTVRLREIERIEERSGFLGRIIVITLPGGLRFQLRLRNPDGFMRALEQGGGPVTSGQHATP